MSVYVVTTDGRLLRYDAPTGQQIWVRHGDPSKIFWEKPQTEVLIAWIHKQHAVSIGFERPVAVEGRMLTVSECSKLTRLAEWLQRRKLPKKIDIGPLVKLVAK